MYVFVLLVVSLKVCIELINLFFSELELNFSINHFIDNINVFLVDPGVFEFVFFVGIEASTVRLKERHLTLHKGFSSYEFTNLLEDQIG